MAGISIDTSQLNRLGVDLGQAAAKVGDRVRTVLRKSALDVEANAKAFAPVDTGTLRSSIGHSDLRAMSQAGALEVEIGPTVSYGHYVEFGTSRMGPAAYMGPALDRVAPSFVAAIEAVAVEIL